MASFLDSVPVSAIIKIRDLMHTVKDPFRLDQGDVSFDAPDSVKQAMAKAIAENQTHYLPTHRRAAPAASCWPRRCARKNGIPIGSDEEVIATNGGTHGHLGRHARAVRAGRRGHRARSRSGRRRWRLRLRRRRRRWRCRCYEELGWRWDLDELERAITPRTRAIYVNSPNNPTRRRPDARRSRAHRRDRASSATCG